MKDFEAASESSSLPRSAVLAVDAAEGWLMLGRPDEACGELRTVEGAFYCHPKVVAMWWQVCATARRWEEAWLVAKAYCRVAPGRPEAWICQANALRECVGLKAAKDLLVSMVGRFPKDPVLPYNLACYSCQLGQLRQSCTWLLKAFKIERSPELKLLALLDPDLEPLWDRIAGLSRLTVRDKGVTVRTRS
jgi:hypothetical protein